MTFYFTTKVVPRGKEVPEEEEEAISNNAKKTDLFSSALSVHGLVGLMGHMEFVFNLASVSMLKGSH